MTLFSIASLSVVILCIFLSFIVFIFSTKKAHYIWAIFNVIVAMWGLAIFMAGISKAPDKALMFWRLTYLPCTFISVVYYHVIVEFCGIKRARMFSFAYIQGVLFAPLIIFSNYFVGSTLYLFNSVHYHKATFLFAVWLVLWFVIVASAFVELHGFIKKSQGIQKTQALYLFWGMLLGHTGGAITVIPSFNIPIYPAWHFLIGVYAAICTYAIFRYQLMDIRVAITRLGVFVAVYSLVLGIPFGLAILGKPFLIKAVGENWFWVPMFTLLVLATTGPFIFLYLQRRAEEQILQEENRIKRVLMVTSAGINVIKDLGKLLKIIIDVLIKNLRLDRAAIYLFDENENKFVLKIAEPSNSPQVFFNNDCPLVTRLKQKKYPILYEEMTYLSQNKEEMDKVKGIFSKMQDLSAAIIIPLHRDKDLLGFISLGERGEKKPYSKALTDNLLIVANEVALGIENAKFFEDIKSTQQQLFQAEKMATIGTMADGLSHQINNRFHALGFIAGDAVDTIHLNQNEPMSDKIKEIMGQLERAFTRVQENVVQGGEIVQGLLRYTRKGEAGFTAVDIDAVLNASLEMTQFKIKTNELKVIREYDPAVIPKIKGNFTQLQEVFFNLIDNGYDAMMQRKNEKKEPGFQATLKVSVSKENNNVWVIFQDNGMGIKPEDMRKLFTPFFTTKLSTKKGTGLGLYVIKKIVEENHGGKVEIVSNYMQGTQMKLCLPVAMG